VQTGSDLTTLAAQRRKLADQAAGLLVAAVVFGAVAVTGHFRVFTGLVAVVSLAGAAFLGYLYNAAADGIRRGADDLILHRYPYEQRDDRVSRIVAKRVKTVDSRAYRRNLALGLRRRVYASEHPATMPIASHTAQGLAEHRALVDSIADRIEQGNGDPATLVQVGRFLRAPHLTADMTPDSEAEALEVELRRIDEALVS
jgi:hypothetical protein